MRLLSCGAIRLMFQMHRSNSSSCCPKSISPIRVAVVNIPSLLKGDFLKGFQLFQSFNYTALLYLFRPFLNVLGFGELHVAPSRSAGSESGSGNHAGKYIYSLLNASLGCPGKYCLPILSFGTVGLPETMPSLHMGHTLLNTFFGSFFKRIGHPYLCRLCKDFLLGRICILEIFFNLINNAFCSSAAEQMFKLHVFNIGIRKSDSSGDATGNLWINPRLHSIIIKFAHRHKIEKAGASNVPGCDGCNRSCDRSSWASGTTCKQSSSSPNKGSTSPRNTHAWKEPLKSTFNYFRNKARLPTIRVMLNGSLPVLI